MFIEIDESCLGIIETNNKYEIFFNAIAYEILKGRNYYYIPKKMLEYLYNNNKLGDEPREIYRKLFNRSFEDMEIKKSVNRRMKIVYDTSNNNTCFINQEYIIPIEQIVNLEIPDKMNIVAENLSDCKFYVNLAKIYKNRQDIKSVNIEISKIAGGGSTISDSYKEIVEEKKFSFFIVDTDTKYSGAPLGQTYKKINKTRDKLIKSNINCDYAEIYTLKAHEVENIIPLKLIEKYYLQNHEEQSKDEVIIFLKNFTNQKFDNQNPLIFFDMKNGIEVSRWKGNKLYKKYWKKVLDEMNYVYDENILLGGFGNNLLRKINSFIEKNLEDMKFWEENIDEYITTEWEEIGKIIFSYGCARKRISC